jgi:hypothetical protein
LKYKSGDFFTGFALAVTYFEYEANRILGMFFQDPIPLNKIEWWSLTSKIRRVFRLNLIEENVYSKILEIIETRNRLIHPTEEIDKEDRRHDLFLRFLLNEKEKSSLLSFKECYSELVQTDFRVFKERQGNSEQPKDSLTAFWIIVSHLLFPSTFIQQASLGVLPSSPSCGLM